LNTSLGCQQGGGGCRSGGSTRWTMRTWLKGAVIGRGAFGQVHRGLDKRTGRLYAI
ncbi:unnamed protein product, partial [Heterosigma akashiwo]